MAIAFKGAANILSGYGRVFLNLAERLQPRLPLELLAIDNQVSDDWPLPIAQMPTARQLGIIICTGDKAMQLVPRYKVCFTMYEASDIPEIWKHELRNVQEVWVPTTFCQEVFGCYFKTRLVPVGYDERVFCRRDWSRDERDRFWLENCPEAFDMRVIGTAGVMSPRKGIDLLIRAWQVADLKDTVLVIKTRQRKMRDVQLPNVYVIDEDWPESKLVDFYRSLDLFVLPTRGDGLALPPLEAAACGTPSLVTRASGPVDYIDDRGVYGIEVRGMVHADNINAKNARWYEPSGSDFVDKLRDFCENGLTVEHQYRDWSAGFLADRWEAEIRGAWERSR